MNIKEAAARYLEHRPRTIKEMENHLSLKDYSEDEIDETISELKNFGYLNDVEYVIAYLNYGFSKGKGIRLIKYELYDKGVSDNDIEEGLAAFEEEFDFDFISEEVKRAVSQAEKVIEDADEIDEKLAMKVARRLSSKGYDSNVVFNVIEELKRKVNGAVG